MSFGSEQLFVIWSDLTSLPFSALLRFIRFYKVVEDIKNLVHLPLVVTEIATEVLKFRNIS